MKCLNCASKLNMDTCKIEPQWESDGNAFCSINVIVQCSCGWHNHIEYGSPDNVLAESANQEHWINP